MYRKAVGLLVLGSSMFLACLLCVRGVDAARLYSEPVQRLKLELWELEEKAKEREEALAGEMAREALAKEQEGLEIDLEGLQNVQEGAESYGSKSTPTFSQGGLGITGVAVSGQRVVDYNVLEFHYAYELSDDEMGVLLRIVEAEAGNEDEEGKLLVANVVLNRVENDAFPDTVSGVVFQKEKGVTQFSPVSNGSYYRVEISDETVNAVGRALMGEDISQGALYFAARKYADRDKMKWFDEQLTFLFAHGGHEFFK